MKLEDIKFKAKRLDNGEWIEGEISHFENTIWIVPIEHKPFHSGCAEVDPDTICMFTGLKDKNDVPIFECDIIDFGGEGEVVFKDGAFYAKFGKYTECLLCNLVKSGQPVTIVGNKFDRKKGEK